MSAGGPYIVRRLQHCACGGCDATVAYREAFATLEEARRAIDRVAYPHDRERSMCSWKARQIGPGGGSISFPNGDVIEVEVVDDADLRVALSRTALSAVLLHPDWPTHSVELTCLAWNAEHGIGIGEPCDHCEGSGTVWGEDEDGNADDPECESSCGRCGGTGTARDRRRDGNQED